MAVYLNSGFVKINDYFKVLCMFVINAICNGCRLVVVGNFGALNVVFNTWVFLFFYLQNLG